NPVGADIMIDGIYYGKTPATLKIEPRDYTAILNKEGYGVAQIKLESWQATRSKKDEGGRCLVDAFGSVLILPLISVFSVYCRDFKKQRYSVIIPYMGPVGSAVSDNFSVINSAKLPYSGGFPKDGAYSREQFYDPSAQYSDKDPKRY
ncbi:MAG TPA: PEGA domain-containing protein, partial [Rickettsiales bacterium]|nr:PEGA domain-containing protein [Rickettsiales bacterium]